MRLLGQHVRCSTVEVHTPAQALGIQCDEVVEACATVHCATVHTYTVHCAMVYTYTVHCAMVYTYTVQCATVLRYTVHWSLIDIESVTQKSN